MKAVTGSEPANNADDVVDGGEIIVTPQPDDDAREEQEAAGEISSEPAEFHQGADPNVWHATLEIPPKMAEDIQRQVEKERAYKQGIAKQWHEKCAGISVPRDAALHEAIESVRQTEESGTLQTLWLAADRAIREVRYEIPKEPVGELTAKHIADYVAHLDMQQQLVRLWQQQTRDAEAGLPANPMLAQDIADLTAVLNDSRNLQGYLEAGFASAKEAKKGTLTPIKPESEPKFCMFHEAFKQAGIFDRLENPAGKAPQNTGPSGKGYMIVPENDHVRLIFLTEDALKQNAGWQEKLLATYRVVSPTEAVDVAELTRTEFTLKPTGGSVKNLQDVLDCSLKGGDSQTCTNVSQKPLAKPSADIVR